MIYLDNAATSFPKPRSVTEEAVKALTVYGANPGRSGHDLSRLAEKTVYNCRCAVGRLFGVKPENVVFTQNATHALNTAILGSVKTGDHIIMSDLEHNSVARPVYNSGCEYSILNTSGTKEEILNRFESLIRPNTRIAVMTLCSNVTGEVLPYREIGKIANTHGVFFIADASQLAGNRDINLIKDNINILCAPGHKGLLGAQGSGIMLLNGLVPKPIIYGGTGTLSVSKSMPENPPERFEAGTLNTPAIASLLRGVEYVEALGCNRIGEYEHSLALSAYNLLKDNERFSFLLPPQTGILSFNVKGYSSEQVAEILNDGGFCVRGGLHCSPLAHKKYGTENIGAVRISVGMHNNARQISNFCRFLIEKF